MDVVITLAGHSRRFNDAGYKEPKFLIPIDGKLMIEHVVDMFDSEDSFHFVLNTAQVSDFPEIPKLLNSLSAKVYLTIIEPHELGPTYSALQVENIPLNKEVIISYCDFFVDWDYKMFKRIVYEYDGAIPAFNGFHPASFGNTYYAYMKVNDKNEMLELREKSSFTTERHMEFASSGIYYFREWGIFRKYAENLLREGFGDLKEAYVSLLFNPMVRDGLKVKVTPVKKFICWGTPEDLEQYLFWSSYFNSSEQEASSLISNNHKQVNLIPLAGKGSRFKSFGYRASKPLIQVKGKPMIVAACESFPAADRWIFLPRQDDINKHPITEALRQFSHDCVILPVQHDTSGQAATCLLAENEIAPNDSLFIASCDYETRYSASKWNDILLDKTIDGAIWTFRLNSNLTKDPRAFAYCMTDEDNKTIIKIVEKNVISDSPEKDPMVVGSFWFRYAKDFIHAARTAIMNNITVNGEHYVANSINILLGEGKRFVIFDIDQWISFGDPFELQTFEYWEEFYLDKNKYVNSFF